MSRAIRFALNGDEVKIEDLSASTTLLNWLRYDRGLTGSKEGCAEGDCGACTIALRRNDGPWEPACACIMLIGMVHGCEVLTIEGVESTDGRLHPVQTALAVGHGSQCGFCTPGIAMTLWTAYNNGAAADPASVATLLSGNLCRCTGYGPILDAYKDATLSAAPDWLPACADIEDGDGLTYTAAGRNWHAPVAEEALSDLLLENPSATILSGATDVGLWVTKNAYDPDTVIYTGRVEHFDRVVELDGWLEIGAGASYARALPSIEEHMPDFGRMIRRIGGSQIRTMGTIGGNIANGSPIGDMAPALIAAGARLVLQRGDRSREMAIEDFFVAYGEQDLRSAEFVSSVRIPIPEDPERLKCYKLSKRFDQDITAVLGCFDVEIAHGVVRGARIAFGGMAGVPARAQHAEDALIRRPWTPEIIGEAMDALGVDFQPLTDHRASSAYRIQSAQNMLLRYYYERTRPDVLTRVAEVTA